jgi:hypothetical protein
MTTIDQHGSTPRDLALPVHRHSSENVRSTNDAGGKVERSNYAGKTPNDPTSQGRSK